jgi:hypothetical protein
MTCFKRAQPFSCIFNHYYVFRTYVHTFQLVLIICVDCILVLKFHNGSYSNIEFHFTFFLAHENIYSVARNILRKQSIIRLSRVCVGD